MKWFGSRKKRRVARTVSTVFDGELWVVFLSGDGTPLAECLATEFTDAYEQFREHILLLRKESEVNEGYGVTSGD